MTGPVNEGSPAWSADAGELLRRLDTTPVGLTQLAAAARVPQVQTLRLGRPTAWRLLVKQFQSPIVILLFCSALLSLTLIDDVTNGAIILAILVVSGMLGFWQEWSANDAVARLLGRIALRTTVLRDGREVETPADQVVPGDVIHLRAGDLVPADCRLLTAHDLFVDEAALTGESFPVEKAAAVLPRDVPLGQRTNSLFLGTHVVSGMATAVVTTTGAQTEFGRIAARLEQSSPETGFERGLRQFGQLLINVVVGITGVVLLVKVVWQQRPLVESLLVGLALAVGMTPQLLPAITSVVLSAGALAMSKRQVIVKQLIAIENLGGMTVLCSDKTGTLTEGIIQLQSALGIDGQPCDNVLRHAYYNASLQTGFGNPIDDAIRRFREFPLDDVQKLDELPYDFGRKRLSIHIRRAGEGLLITKGALTSVLDCCRFARTADGADVPLTDVQPQIDAGFLELSRQGLRVLGVAVRPIETASVTKADERDMTFLGLIVLSDPPKADAPATLERLRELGVELKIVTGDNRAVADAIARRIGLAAPVLMTGGELSRLDRAALRQRAAEANVFAEVEPNQKELIILALQDSGHVVGYLGDGINDASALHAADIGISVASAVDVAREAAEVVLLQHDLGVLADGIREGRKTLENTLKYVFYAIAANFGYMFSLGVSSLFLPFEPLLAHQILLVNLLADFPAMTLAADRVDPEQIQRPKRWDVKFIVQFMMIFGLASSAFDFLTFAAIFLAFGGDNPLLFNTGWFMESTLTGLVILLIIRTPRPSLKSRPSGLLMVAALLVAVVTVVIPYSSLSAPLGFVTPPARLTFTVLAITLLYGAGLETVKWLFYRKRCRGVS